MVYEHSFIIIGRRTRRQCHRSRREDPRNRAAQPRHRLGSHGRRARRRRGPALRGVPAMGRTRWRPGGAPRVRPTCCCVPAPRARSATKPTRTWPNASSRCATSWTGRGWTQGPNHRRQAGTRRRQTARELHHPPHPRQGRTRGGGAAQAPEIQPAPVRGRTAQRTMAV